MALLWCRCGTTTSTPSALDSLFSLFAPFSVRSHVKVSQDVIMNGIVWRDTKLPNPFVAGFIFNLQTARDTWDFYTTENSNLFNLVNYVQCTWLQHVLLLQQHSLQWWPWWRLLGRAWKVRLKQGWHQYTNSKVTFRVPTSSTSLHCRTHTFNFAVFSS